MSWKQLYFNLNEVEEGHLAEAPVQHESRVFKTDQPFGNLGNSNFNVIHDTVILHTMNVEKKYYRVIEMRDPELVDLFTTYFNIMWERAEKVDI